MLDQGLKLIKIINKMINTFSWNDLIEMNNSFEYIQWIIQQFSRNIEGYLIKKNNGTRINQRINCERFT